MDAQKTPDEVAWFLSKKSYSHPPESCHWLNAVAERLFFEHYDFLRDFVTLKIRGEIVDIWRIPAGWIMVRSPPSPVARCPRRAAPHGSRPTRPGRAAACAPRLPQSDYAVQSLHLGRTPPKLNNVVVLSKAAGKNDLVRRPPPP